MSRFFCLYIPHFQAWAARRVESTLTSAPFAVYVKDHIVAASPEAILAGVQVGWTLHRMESLLPEIHAIAANPSQCEAVWQDALATAYSFTPQLESLRPGLLMADAKPGDMAPLVSEWRAHAGHASNRATAEIAAYAARRGEVRAIPRGREADFLSAAPLSLLTHAGISSPTLERLEWFGWTTVGALTDAKEGELLSQFAEGKELFRFAQLKDVRRVPAYVPPPTIFERISFEEPARQPGEWEGALKILVKDVVAELGERQTHKIEVVVETSKDVFHGPKLLRDPIRDVRTLYTFAHDSITKALAFCEYLEINALELHLGALSHPKAIQGELFATKGQASATIGFDKILRGLFARFPDCIVRAVIVDPEAAIPEEAYKFVPIHRVGAPKKPLARAKAKR